MLSIEKLFIYTTCFKSWHFSEVGAWEFKSASAPAKQRLAHWPSVMQPDLKAQDTGEDKNQFLEYVVYTKDQYPMIKLLLTFIVFFIVSSDIDAEATCLCTKNHTHINKSIVHAKGAHWRCKGCNGYNYSEEADWRGKYYCIKCKTSKTD